MAGKLEKLVTHSSTLSMRALFAVGNAWNIGTALNNIGCSLKKKYVTLEI
jgi:hypothetical protein